MNPDIYSPEYQIAASLDRAQRDARVAHQAELHRKAVARRRKAKRGGKR